MSFSSRSSLTSVGWRVWEANPVLCPIRLDRRHVPQPADTAPRARRSPMSGPLLVKPL